MLGPKTLKPDSANCLFALPCAAVALQVLRSMDIKIPSTGRTGSPGRGRRTTGGGMDLAAAPTNPHASGTYALYGPNGEVIHGAYGQGGDGSGGVGAMQWPPPGVSLDYYQGQGLGQGPGLGYGQAPGSPAGQSVGLAAELERAGQGGGAGARDGGGEHGLVAEVARGGGGVVPRGPERYGMEAEVEGTAGEQRRVSGDTLALR